MNRAYSFEMKETGGRRQEAGERRTGKLANLTISQLANYCKPLPSLRGVLRGTPKQFTRLHRGNDKSMDCFVPRKDGVHKH